ncbi:TIGR03617 family F420-dependent LLM class oxidoreductase [Micromonospora sp. NPDC050200]|uniref:TIGR03617 family F420-dependent LLM class oxidoreductase n=1 Tax=Micromonospora sp. NPDC050200 TaxID=3155664 RepID=UPI0033F73AA2
MEIVTTLPADTPLDQVAARIRRIERLGFDTVHIPETVHDSLAVALLAAEHSTRLSIRTSMTLAFPRSPMVTAYAAWDLARFSGGRFQLGLATQVRGNIEGRFSVAWSDPAGRLADYLRAMRAIFDSFRTGRPLAHHGEHYRFTRLQPYFNPGGADVRPPQLWTGGVNRRACEVAGELADGFVTHATNSHPRFLRGHCLPALAAGARRAGRSDGGPQVVVVSKCVTAPDRAALCVALDAARREFAFLYSTPAYRPTLRMLGHARVGERLTELVRAERWADLPGVLTDDILATLVPQATYAELPELLRRWYGDIAHGLAVGLPPDDRHDDEFAELVRQLRAIPVAGPPARPDVPNQANAW